MENMIETASTYPECQNYFRMIRCALSCTGKSFLSIGEKDGVTLKLCDGFCDDFFEACRGVELMGLTIGSLYTRAEDFCTVQDEENVRFSVVPSTQNCFGGFS